MTVAFLNTWGILFKGGPMMWPIFLLSVAVMTIAIEKFISLNAVEDRMQALKAKVFEAIKQNHLKEAVEECEKNTSLMGQILKAGILKFGTSRDIMKTAMEEKAVIEIHELKQRLGILALITNVAPLLGLLGTISGMCVVFHAVQMRSNALNPLNLGDMSSGIWQALLTTAAGLIVGILSLAAHSFCADRVNGVIVQIDADILETMNVLQSMAEVENGFPPSRE